MKRFLMVLATLLMASIAFSQTPSTAPTVLGCTNPAPAVPPAATVFISSCKTPAFLPTTTTSVVASVSKTSPVFAHTLSGYTATDKIVACPAGAVVSGATCTVAGVDASALVVQSQVSTFAITPPVTIKGTLTWVAPTTNDDGTPLTDLASFNIYQSGALLGNVPTGTLTYSVGTLTAGQTYSFSVTAVNQGGTESVPATATTTVPVPKKTPSAPTNLTITVK